MTIKRIIIVGFIVLTLEGIAGYIYLTHRQDAIQVTIPTKVSTNTPQPQIAPASKKATLTLHSGKQTIKKGDNFTVNVMLDTFANPTTATDLTIKYNPQFISVIATDSAHPFSASPSFQRMVFNSLDAKAGLATMSAVAEIGKGFNGQGLLTSLPFKAVKSGSVDISIVFTPRETRDTNVVSDTEDILESVENLSLNILP